MTSLTGIVSIWIVVLYLSIKRIFIYISKYDTSVCFDGNWILLCFRYFHHKVESFI